MLKIIGVTVTNGLSVSLHIQTAISSCAQILYALRVLRAHGLHDSALQNIYRSVVLAKLLYASSFYRAIAICYTVASVVVVVVVCRL